MYTIKEVQGCYQSYDMDGNKLIYSGSKWQCEFFTKKLLNMELDDGHVVNDGVVEGKL